MDSSIIGKIDKARKYAEEKERVSINSFSATFQGNHNSYDVSFNAGAWDCECHFFATRAVCSHTIQGLVVGDLGSSCVLVVGAGEAGETAAEALSYAGARSVTVVNRTYSRAAELAGRLAGHALDFDSLPQALAASDIRHRLHRVSRLRPAPRHD